MTTRHLQWRRTFDTHGDSLEGFEDATTVRYILACTKNWLSEERRIYDALLGREKLREEWRHAFDEDRSNSELLMKELENWLAGRSLQL